MKKRICWLAIILCLTLLNGCGDSISNDADSHNGSEALAALASPSPDFGKAGASSTPQPAAEGDEVEMDQGEEEYISGTGTVAENSGGHYVSYAGTIYYRQYEENCFYPTISRGVQGFSYDYLAGGSTKMMRLNRDGSIDALFDDDGYGPIFIEDDAKGSTRFYLNYVEEDSDFLNVYKIYSVDLNGTDRREHGDGKIFAVDIERDIIIAYDQTEWIRIIRISDGRETDIADEYHTPRYYDYNEGVLYCEDYKGYGEGYMSAICSISVDSGIHFDLFKKPQDEISSMLGVEGIAGRFSVYSLRPAGESIRAYIAYISGWNPPVYEGGGLFNIRKDAGDFTIEPSPREIDWFGPQQPFSYRATGPFYKNVGGYYMCGLEELIEPELVLSEADLAAVGLKNGEYFDEDRLEGLLDVEYVNAMLFFTVVTASRDSKEDPDWHSFHEREQCRVYKKDLISGEIELLYSY